MNLDLSHMITAFNYASNSYCERAKIGAVIVKDDRIISIGYNGTPSGWDNECECDDVTHPYVLHAEANAITKLAKSNESGEGATLFCTHSPCKECAKLIIQTGIVRVVYVHAYRDTTGIQYLIKSNIKVENFFIREVSDKIKKFIESL